MQPSELDHESVVVTSNVACGPVQVGDGTIASLVGRLIAVVSASAINLHRYTLTHPADGAAARRLTALSAIGAAGELRTLLLLCTTGLPMYGRIHVRSLDECLRRIAVYYADPDLATRTVETFADFQADGFAKLSESDRAMFTSRNIEVEDRLNEIMVKAQEPIRITGHTDYKEQLVGLDAFSRWYYSQTEHCTAVALGEYEHRLSLCSDVIYATDESISLLVTAIGIMLSICAHLACHGVALTAEFRELEAELKAVLGRHGLLDPY